MEMDEGPEQSAKNADGTKIDSFETEPPGVLAGRRTTCLMDFPSSEDFRPVTVP